MSNIDVTPGSGKTVATETVGGIEYQKVQLWGAGGGSILGISSDGSAKVSVIGTVTVIRTGNASISGAVTAPAGSIMSVVATAPAGSILSVAAAQSGAWATSIAPVASFISGVTSIITSTALNSVLSAAGTGIKNYVTHIIVTNGSATGTFVDIKDGGGNVMYSGYAAASGGGFSSFINPPIVGSANKSVDAQPRAQASIIVAMTGYTA